RARFGLEIEDSVGIAQRRQAFGNCVALFGDDVLVFDRAGGDLNPGHFRHVAGPDTGGIDHNLALDGALVGEDARDAPAITFEPFDQHTLDDAYPARARALGIGHRQARWLDRAVRGNEYRADDAVRRDQRELFQRLL